MTVLLRSGHIMCRSHIFDVDVLIVYFTCGVTSRGLDQWGRSACFTCHLHARKRERERKKGGGEGVSSGSHFLLAARLIAHLNNISHLCSPFARTGFCFLWMLLINPSSETSGCCG